MMKHAHLANHGHAPFPAIVLAATSQGHEQVCATADEAQVTIADAYAPGGQPAQRSRGRRPAAAALLVEGKLHKSVRRAHRPIVITFII